MDMDILFCHVQLMITMLMIRMPEIKKAVMVSMIMKRMVIMTRVMMRMIRMKTLVPAPCWFGWVASLVWPPFCPSLLLLCPPTTWQRVACNSVAGFSKYVLVMASGKNCWLLRLYNLLQFLLLVHPGHLLLYSLVKDGFCACLVVEIICITKDCQHQRHHQPHLLAWKAKRTWNDSGSEHLWPSISWKNDLKCKVSINESALPSAGDYFQDIRIVLSVQSSQPSVLKRGKKFTRRDVFTFGNLPTALGLS